MTFGAQTLDRRRRRRSAWRIIQVLLVLVAPLATFGVGYGVGDKLEDSTVAQYKTEIDELQMQLRRLQRERDGMIQQVTTAQANEQQWQQRYQADVPTGQRLDLMNLIDEQLRAGVDVGRLSRFIVAAAATRDCESPDTKRFFIQTPSTPSARQAITFGGGAVTVTGDGAAAEGDNGGALAYFDQTKPITMTFTLIGGQRFEAQGVLPVHTSVLVGQDEMRFTVIENELRGYVQVSAAICK